MKKIALCYKCSNKIIQPDMLDKRCSVLVGCKELTKKEWEDGYYSDGDGPIYQHKCPVLPKLRGSNDDKG